MALHQIQLNGFVQSRYSFGTFHGFDPNVSLEMNFQNDLQKFYVTLFLCCMQPLTPINFLKVIFVLKL